MKILTWEFKAVLTRSKSKPSHVYPKNNTSPDKSYEIQGELDFDTAMSKLANDGQSIYYFDENAEFWFVPAFTLKGAKDLTNCILRGTSGKTMAGHCNRIYCFGGVIPGISPDMPLSEIKTHALIYAMAEDKDDIGEYGLMIAPWHYRPNCNKDECQKIANSLLNWYVQFRDVPMIKICGKAPPLLSKVSYIPWNGNMPPTTCSPRSVNIIFGPIVGIVTRRIVDLDANTGFTCELEIATNQQDLGDATDLGLGGDPAVDYGDTPETNPLSEVAFN